MLQSSRRFHLMLSASSLLVALHAGVLRAQSTPQAPLGFLPGSRSAHLKAEAEALAVPTPDRARAWLRRLTEEPHPAGSRADHDTALFVRDRLREWGWEAELAEYEVLLNTPITEWGNNRKGPVLELVAPEAKTLSLVEAPNRVDKDSADPAAFPAFHGYGVSGDVTGQVVYANYGQPDDFAALEKLGVDVRGKIVLVRYGGIFRGLKVRNAQKRGAKGILIYSDPADDGYARGDVYPHGPYRPGSAIQRGSVQFLSLGPGDPSTPDGPSIKGAKRLPWDRYNGFTLNRFEPSAPPHPNDKVEIPPGTPIPVSLWEKLTGQTRDDYFATIPSLPISYDAARPILEAMGGPNVPTGWQGGLPLPYHVGPGPAIVHFGVQMHYEIKTIWNVVATLKGSVEPDRWVMMGNHRDAWVYGAVDPSSGTAATLEACRALGAAVKAGWKPRRSIVYASWDAEEYGLVGSTEWADHHADELDTKAVLLLNVDSAVSGPELDLDGVPSLRDLLLEAAGVVTDVPSGKSLRAAWTEKRRAAWAASGPVEFYDPLWADLDPSGAGADGSRPASTRAGTSPARLAIPPAEFTPQLNALGSGSDYTAFLDHLGIPAVDVGFTGRYGVYHSIFDNFYWMEKFGDPEFVTHATAARLYTAFAMRAAGAEVLPLTFTPYAHALRDYVDDLRRTVERRARARGARGETEASRFAGTLADVARAVRAFQAEAMAVDRATRDLAGRESVDRDRLVAVNDALQRVERAFLLPDGLPGRRWFKHAIYAPGLTTGYASWPLPGLRQAVLDHDSELLKSQGPALIGRIEAATAALRRAADAAKP